MVPAPMRFFNTAGVCKPDIHYLLPPERRLPEVRGLIEQQAYFVMHAPRQVGKTTALHTLARALTAEGRFAAVLVSMESGQPFCDDVGMAERAMLAGWRAPAEAWLPPDLRPPPWPDAAPGARLGAALGAWSRACTRPLVIFLDEIDALRDPALSSVLRQLRDGHTQRPQSFPWALALVGMRDVRDYKSGSGAGKRSGSASPFNIKERSLTMREFTAAEVAELYAQHTTATGQAFEEAAVARAFDLTQGQPWLVNSLAKVAVEELVIDRSAPVTLAAIDRSKDVLIQRQETHLDSLAERLREERVRRVIAPILAGGVIDDVPDDDRRFVVDLGLVRRGGDGGLEIANPIYREVLPRTLAQGVIDSLPRIAATWLDASGTLDRDRLLTAFMAFWREHGEALMGAAPYSEVAAQLVMMAFLSRVTNGGGSIEREYALGRGRIDLCVRYRDQRVGIELKAWRTGQRDPMPKGLSQLDEYLESLGENTGWLVVFDQRAGRPPPSKRMRATKKKTPAGRRVTVVRL